MRSQGRLASILTVGLVAGLACLAASGCSSGAAGAPDDDLDSRDDAGGPGTGSGSATSGAGGAGGAGSGTGGHGAETVAGTVGIVVIDVQEAFVGSASNADMAGIIDRTRGAFELASEHDVPFFITFEGSKQGEQALHAPLQPALPAHAQDFVKTTFGATGLTYFSNALEQSGLSHLVVLGAETDVCVLQTVLGLRAMGFTVMLQEDATFTEETNTSPALRRMQQAGTLLVSQAEVAGYVASPGALPKGGDAAVTITRPLQLGVVLNDFTDAALAATGDPLEPQKSARLKELLLVSEWFDLPVYVGDVGAGLPAAFGSYFQGELRPISQIAQDAAVEQLVFAGTDGGLAEVISAWIGARELFVMEDALLAAGAPGSQKAMLQPFYEGGLVPTTYKSFYYDMTKSVDPAEWPSQAWVQKFEEYYWLTQAPEDLPPIPSD